MTSLSMFPLGWQELWGESLPEGGVGAVYTKPEIVELMLDLSGYCVTQPLRERVVLEPSCGDGAFLDCILSRLCESEAGFPAPDGWDNRKLETALLAIDLDEQAVAQSRKAAAVRLISAGCPPGRAGDLADLWIRVGDFLLEERLPVADLVIGNPPYVRPENLPKQVLAEYRRRFRTLTDRSDVYVAFFERGLSCLSPNGRLAFITANRFAKNTYGRRLRQLLTERFHVAGYLNLEHTQPFAMEVSAYPAITLIDRTKKAPTYAVTLEDVDEDTLRMVRASYAGKRQDIKTDRFDAWYSGEQPWLTTDEAEYRFLKHIEQELPTLEESAPGTVVGIGVATGADGVFVLPGPHPDIEPDRQIPLAMARDVSVAGVEWSGHILLNPFDRVGDGSLIDLRDYPGMARYLKANSKTLSARHVARSRPKAWYRTIDRIWPRLATEPKLLIPDIQKGSVVGLDEGKYYPHHNLYWVQSSAWPLEALQAILRSEYVTRQVRAHSVQMRGGSLRYQAQVLRKLRIPHLASLDGDVMSQLMAVASSDQLSQVDKVVARAFRQAGIEMAAPDAA